MLKVLILSAVVVGLSFVALGFRVLFTRTLRFPDSSVENNPELRKLGLHCASHDEFNCQGRSGENFGCACHTDLSGKPLPEPQESL